MHPDVIRSGKATAKLSNCQMCCNESDPDALCTAIQTNEGVQNAQNKLFNKQNDWQFQFWSCLLILLHKLMAIALHLARRI